MTPPITIVVDREAGGLFTHDVEESHSRQFKGNYRKEIKDWAARSNLTTGKEIFDKFLDNEEAANEARRGNLSKSGNLKIFENMVFEEKKQKAQGMSVIERLQQLKLIQSYSSTSATKIKGMIQSISADDFKVMIFMEEGLRLYSSMKSKINYTLYIDATGCFSPPINEKRDILQYTLFMEFPEKGYPGFPLAHMISDAKDCPEISNFLMKIVQGFSLLGLKLLIRLLAMDFSWTLLHSSLTAFNKISIHLYLVYCDEIILGKWSKDKIENLTFFIFCAYHIYKALCKKLSKMGLDWKEQKYVEKCLIMLINSTEPSQIERILENIMILLEYSITNKGLTESKKKLDELLEEYGDDVQSTKFEDEVSQIEKDYIEDFHNNTYINPEVIKKNSYFYEKYSAIYTDIKKNAPKNNEKGEANKFQCIEFLEYFKETYFAVIPLWTGIMLTPGRYCKEYQDEGRKEPAEVGRETTGKVESYFNTTKYNILKKSNRIPVYDYVNALCRNMDRDLRTYHVNLKKLQKKAKNKGKNNTDIGSGSIKSDIFTTPKEKNNENFYSAEEGFKSAKTSTKKKVNKPKYMRRNVKRRLIQAASSDSEDNTYQSILKKKKKSNNKESFSSKDKKPNNVDSIGTENSKIYDEDKKEYEREKSPVLKRRKQRLKRKIVSDNSLLTEDGDAGGFGKKNKQANSSADNGKSECRNPDKNLSAKLNQDINNDKNLENLNELNREKIGSSKENEKPNSVAESKEEINTSSSPSDIRRPSIEDLNMPHNDLLFNSKKMYTDVETRLAPYDLKQAVAWKYQNVLLKKDLIFNLVPGSQKDERGFHQGWIEGDMVSFWYAMMTDHVQKTIGENVAFMFDFHFFHQLQNGAGESSSMLSYANSHKVWDYKVWLIPINMANTHFSCMLINFQPEQNNEENQFCEIVYIDGIEGYRNEYFRKFVDIILRFIKIIYRNVTKKDDFLEKTNYINVYEITSIKQRDSRSCGIYALLIAYLVAHNDVAPINDNTCNEFRKYIAARCMNTNEEEENRKYEERAAKERKMPLAITNHEGEGTNNSLRTRGTLLRKSMEKKLYVDIGLYLAGVLHSFGKTHFFTRSVDCEDCEDQGED